MSVCWKCATPGHIGDKCFQDVSALAASLVGSSVSHQPSWAHVVRGAKAGPQYPQFPLPPPLPLLPPPAGKLCAPITARAVQLAKSRLEVGERFDAAGVQPEFCDEFVREQLNKKAKAFSLSACQLRSFLSWWKMLWMSIMKQQSTYLLLVR